MAELSLKLIYKQLRAFFSKETATLSRHEAWYIAILAGAFSSLFLIFFQPFGVNNYDPTEKIRPVFIMAMLGMGLLVAVVILGNEFLVRPFTLKTSNRGTAFLWLFWNIVSISTAIFFYYNFLGNWHDFRWSSYLEFIGNISSMAVLPLILIYFYISNKRLKESLSRSYDSTYKAGAKDTITFIAENNKDTFIVNLSHLLYLVSEDNYVAIFHLEDQTVCKTLLRQSLKNIQESNLHDQLIRCHRSYMINLINLESMHGNRNKLTLKLKYTSNAIPVSRQYIDEMLNIVKG